MQNESPDFEKYSFNMQNTQHSPSVRLDKWLWAARLYKTRRVAKAMITGGKVHYNQQRAKSSKIVAQGAIIRLIQGNEMYEIRVLGLSEQRLSAVEAQKLYQETEKSLAYRTHIAEAKKLGALTMPHPARRPTKKERKQLIEFKTNSSFRE